MQTTLAGRGTKCRVCTHPERVQIESLLARGAGIAAIKPIMGDNFSRRALYRHRARHIIHAALPAARPVPFPYGGSTIARLKWLQRENEHTAALAEHQGQLGLKLRALHEVGRLLWLEARLAQDPASTTIDMGEEESPFTPELERRLAEAHEAHELREAAGIDWKQSLNIPVRALPSDNE